MADITSPQAIEFANRRARPAADVLAQTYYTAKQVVDQWNALGGAAAIPNDTSRIMDGSVVDGRPIMTGAKLHNLMNRLTEFVADMEANTSAKLGTVLALAVRVSPRTSEQ